MDDERWRRHAGVSEEQVREDNKTCQYQRSCGKTEEEG